MRDYRYEKYDDKYRDRKRSREAGKRIGKKVGIGEVQENENLRDRKELPLDIGDDLLEFYEAIESVEDVTSTRMVELIFDGSFDAFRQVVTKYSDDLSTNIENKIDQLLDLHDLLKDLSNSGLLEEMQDHELIDPQGGNAEKKTLANYKILQDIALDLLGEHSISILLERFCTEMASIVGRIADKADNPRMRYKLEGHPLMDILEEENIITPYSEGKYISNRERDDRDKRERGGVLTGSKSRRREGREGGSERGLDIGQTQRRKKNKFGRANTAPRRTPLSLRRGDRKEPRDRYEERRPTRRHSRFEERNRGRRDGYYDYEEDGSLSRGRGRSRRSVGRSRRDRRNKREEGDYLQFHSFRDQREEEESLGKKFLR